MTNRSTISVRITQLLALAGALAGLMGVSSAALGQKPNANQFGGQGRADAAAQMIVLGVQQGISSLPPTSGQSFLYEFDPKLDTYVSSDLLGPTALRSPQTIGAGKFSVRFAASYFELADTKQPITFLANDPPGTPFAVAKIGLQANAHVGLVNLGVNYGITDRFEVTLNVPVVVVDAHANQISSGLTTERNLPGSEAQLGGVTIPSGNIGQAINLLNEELQPNGQLFLRRDSFNAMGFTFNTGKHAGLGRISVSEKVVLYAGKLAQVAFAPELFFPSPNQDEFAGSDSAAILPRIIGAFRVSEPVRLHLDAGYDYDFDHNELRRLVWNGGTSIAIMGATFDFGVGGSTFNEGIQWTPAIAPYVDSNGNPGTIRPLESNRLGRTFVDALGGIKVRVANKTVLSGSVNVPLNNDGFRAAAVGTLAVEQYF